MKTGWNITYTYLSALCLQVSGCLYLSLSMALFHTIISSFSLFLSLFLVCISLVFSSEVKHHRGGSFSPIRALLYQFVSDPNKPNQPPQMQPVGQTAAPATPRLPLNNPTLNPNNPNTSSSSLSSQTQNNDIPTSGSNARPNSGAAHLPPALKVLIGLFNLIKENFGSWLAWKALDTFFVVFLLTLLKLPLGQMVRTRLKILFQFFQWL